MQSPRIVLSAGAPHTRTWASESQLQIGRMHDLNVSSTTPRSAGGMRRLILAEEGWVIRDFGSTNGTYLNGVRIGRTPQRLRQGDSIRAGDVSLRIEFLRWSPETVEMGDGQKVHVEAASQRTWDEAVDGFDLQTIGGSAMERSSSS